MRSLRIVGLLVLAGACAKEKPADTAAADTTATAPAAMATGSLASYAGTWTMNTMGSASDSVLLTFTMTATGDTAGWAYNFPNHRAPVPVRVLSDENGVVTTEAGPYDSNLQPGVQVVTRATTRITGDTLRGDVVATYSRASGDTVVNLRTIGTRAH